MPKYHVRVFEVWARTVEIEAETRELALSRAKEGIADLNEVEFDYSHSLENETEAEEL